MVAVLSHNRASCCHYTIGASISCLGIVAALISGGCSSTSSPQPARFPAGEIVDLSHIYDAEAIFWPTAEGFRLEKCRRRHHARRLLLRGEQFFAAPSTAARTSTRRSTLRQGHRSGRPDTARSRLIAPAVVVDVVTRERETGGLSGRPLKTSAAGSGRTDRFRSSAIVLIRTGFSTTLAGCGQVSGHGRARDADAATKLHFPGLHPDAARWLAANRPVKAIGIDTASIDYGPSTAFESHRVLCERDIPAFENLTSPRASAGAAAR